MRTSLALVLVLAAAGRAADAPDDTLGHYLSKSQFALAAEVLSEPVKVPGGENFVGKSKAVYACRLRVVEQFHHTHGPAPTELTLHVVRWADGQDERPLALNKGQKCIIFVNWIYSAVGGSGTAYVTAGPWFGVQRYHGKMAELLRQQGKRPERAN